MTHLREQLSALVDGELTGAELDRAHSHLAACEQCRAEAATLRVLKRELRNLSPAKPSGDFTKRLLAMAGPGGPAPPRRELPPNQRQQPAFRAYPERRRPHLAARRPPSRPSRGALAGHRRPGRVLVGVMALIVAAGVCAFGASLGIDGASGRGLSPGLAFYTLTHGFTPGGSQQIGREHHHPIGPKSTSLP